MSHQTDPVLLSTAATTSMLDGAHVCTVCGEIDVLTAPTFEQALCDCLDRGESTRVDMTGVTFFGVAGIRALLAARDFADRQHCALSIKGSYCVTRVLEVVGLATEFDICQ
ncbi:STAS domain-containing protein [Nocardia sp. NPDC051981]|uniref:STAS domain-containing protein n=1 Tax=Nocardia sp. NPDC051981 TaxID=3155417 RepID=UPI00343B9A21